MKLLISLALVVFAAAALTAKKDPEPYTKDSDLQLQRRISEVDTLLRNIEVYDGTSKGQRRIGGDDR